MNVLPCNNVVTSSCNKLPNEALLQHQIVSWFNNNFCLKHHNPRSILISIPNERVKSQHIGRLISTGLYKGAADMIIIHRGITCFIEVKTIKGKISPCQYAFRYHAIAAGARHAFVRSLEEFVKFVEGI
jgi:hypothetical protein